MESTLNLLLSLLGIGQVVTGFISWYFGMQVKMLRLELVNRETCHARHEKLEKEVSKLYTEIERAKNTHCGEHHA